MKHIYHIKIDQVKTEDSTFDISHSDVIGSAALKTMMWNLDKKRHITISGGAGSGKSYLLKEFIKYIRDHTDLKIRITAPTGIAAFNVEGETIYRALSLGLATEPMHLIWLKIRTLVDNYKKTKVNRKRKRGCDPDSPPYENTLRFLKETDILVLDEAFMLNPEFFTKLDFLARKANANELEPFGGMKLVLVGDAMQLGPIMPPKNTPFIFNTESFSHLNMARIHLCHNYRQRDNAEFLELLNAIRFGNVTAKHLALIRSRIMPTPEGVHSVHMYCHRESVKQENDRRLKQLIARGAKEYKFSAKYDIGIKPYIETTVKNAAEVKIAEERLKNTKFIDDNFMVQDVHFCIGAQMMLRTNAYFELGLFNGSLVEVLDVSPTEGIKVKAITGQELFISPMTYRVPVTKTLDITLNQYPLCLAWAITIHKSQSLTLPCITIGLKECFSAGQLYVAFSRAPDLSGIYLTGFDPKSILTCQTAADFERLPNPFENLEDPIEKDELQQAEQKA